MKAAFRMTSQVRNLRALAKRNIEQSQEPGNHIILYRDAHQLPPLSELQSEWYKHANLNAGVLYSILKFAKLNQELVAQYLPKSPAALQDKSSEKNQNGEQDSNSEGIDEVD